LGFCEKVGVLAHSIGVKANLAGVFAHSIGVKANLVGVFAKKLGFLLTQLG
jgi:hypothetical protein